MLEIENCATSLAFYVNDGLSEYNNPSQDAMNRIEDSLTVTALAIVRETKINKIDRAAETETKTLGWKNKHPTGWSRLVLKVKVAEAKLKTSIANVKSSVWMKMSNDDRRLTVKTLFTISKIINNQGSDSDE